MPWEDHAFHWLYLTNQILYNSLVDIDQSNANCPKFKSINKTTTTIFSPNAPIKHEDFLDYLLH